VNFQVTLELMEARRGADELLTGATTEWVTVPVPPRRLTVERAKRRRERREPRREARELARANAS
jgi:hypothetical protein